MPIKDSYLNGNTKFCMTCGSEIHEKAEICPKCGVRCPDIHTKEDSYVNINSKSINLTSVFTVLGAISGIAIGLMAIYITLHISNVNESSNLIKTPILSLYFLIILIFFSSLSGILGIWISSKNSKLAILEYIIASVGIAISTIVSFIFASSIPLLNVVTGISPIFFVFLGVLTIIFFILAMFSESRNNITNNNTGGINYE